MPTQNAAIFILTQNTESRRVYLKTTLYFLFRHFNAEHKYPVVIFHEGDYDSRAQREILMGIRESCRALVNFVELDPTDFGALPPHIDAKRLKRCLECEPVPYFRNAAYRNMCRWWCRRVWDYAAGYEYIMRLDDDAIIEEPIVEDLFARMAARNLVYTSGMIHVDCGICNYGMKEFFKGLYPDKAAFIDTLFMKQEIPSRDVVYQGFRRLITINAAAEGDALPEIGEKIELQMPIIFYNNFFITKVAFWQRDDVRELLDAIDKTGNIYYWRWGDAPIHTLVLALLADKTEYERTIFRYSKRLQREAFIDDKGESHAYMPRLYSESSCVTEQKK